VAKVQKLSQGMGVGGEAVYKVSGLFVSSGHFRYSPKDHISACESEGRQSPFRSVTSVSGAWL